MDVGAQLLTRRELPGGRRNIDGLLTLAAEQIPAPCDGARAWSATWARKQAGVAWGVSSGAIVAIGDTIAHGADVRRALATVRRRLTIQARGGYLRLAARASERRRARVAAAAEALADLSHAEIVRRWGSLRLTWATARAAGLCDDGVRSWCARHFPELNPRRDSVTAEAALQTGDLTGLVLDAIVIAVARHGAHVEPSAATAGGAR